MPPAPSPWESEHHEQPGYEPQPKVALARQCTSNIKRKLRMSPNTPRSEGEGCHQQREDALPTHGRDRQKQAEDPTPLRDVMNRQLPLKEVLHDP